jgi:hypothetical protein
LNYSIVDLSLEKGLGTVTKKNIPLLDSSVFKLAAVGHNNGKDIWIVTQDIINQCFVSYLFSENGLLNNPVKNPFNIEIKIDIHKFDHHFYNWGYGIPCNLKFSPNGKELVFTSNWNYFTYLFDFNDETGEITNGIKFSEIGLPYLYPSGVEFSENGQFLYVGSIKYNELLEVQDTIKTYLYQYDITSHDPVEIKNSRILISEINKHNHSYDYDWGYFGWSGDLQMGPNNKIYSTIFTDFYYYNDINKNYSLQVINQPNLSGKDCDFKMESIILPDSTMYNGWYGSGFPSVVKHFIPKSIVCDYENITICEGDSLFLYSGYHADADYSWSGPLGFTSSVRNPVIADLKPEMSGDYNYTISRNGNTFYISTIHITVNPKEKILFADNSDLNICAKSYDLKAVEHPENTKINWTGINSNENIVTITKNGKYKVIVENQFGCMDSATINIQFYPAYCEGDTIFLIPKTYYKRTEYIWTGPNGFESKEKYPVIPDSKVNMSGDYNVTIIVNSDFIGGPDTIYTKIPLIVNPKPKILFSEIKEITLCKDSLELQAVDNPEGCKFLWKGINSNENKAVIKNTGIYTVYVESEFGCIDSATIEIKKYNAELIAKTETLTFNELCIGSSETKNIKFALQSDYDLAINYIYFKSNMFNLNNVSSFLKTYKDGETIDLPITFKPLDAGEFYDTLVIKSGEPCLYKKEIPIYGTSKALFQFSLPNIVSEAGDYLMIPINAGMTCPNSVQLNSDYEIEISFDKEYFIPDSVKYGSIIENKIIGQSRILKIKGVTEFKEKKDSLLPINYIYGMALAGRKEIIPLTIDSVNFTNKRYYPEFVNGSLKIEGCVINIRPIQLFNPTKLSIAPNPTDGDIKMSVETQEQGSFKIEIFDIQGQSIYSKEFTKSNSNYEEFEFNYDTKELGSGVYSVHLSSPWHILRQQLVISK